MVLPQDCPQIVFRTAARTAPFSALSHIEMKTAPSQCSLPVACTVYFIKNEIFLYTHSFINIEKQKPMRDECVFLQRSAFLMGFWKLLIPCMLSNFNLCKIRSENAISVF